MKGGRESISQILFIMDHKKVVSNKSSDTDLSFHMVKYAIDLICIVCAFMNVIKPIKQKNVIYLIECIAVICNTSVKLINKFQNV